MSFIDLNWNAATRGIWATRKRDIETRFALLKWIDHDKKVPLFGTATALPYKVGVEIQSYVNRGKITNILQVAYDAQPFNMIYGLRIQYTNGVSTVYLHSNGKRVVCLAVGFIESKTEKAEK